MFDLSSGWYGAQRKAINTTFHIAKTAEKKNRKFLQCSNNKYKYGMGVNIWS